MDAKNLILPACAQMLDALGGQLDKARAAYLAKGAPVDSLMAARLAPDMLPLSMQVRFSCLQAEEALGRLLDNPIEEVAEIASFEEARNLVVRTADRLRAAGGEAGDIDPDRAVELVLRSGMTFDLSLFEYVRSWSIPQFYFHLITAYAIMRHHGVDIGKADYVPHIFQFKRETEE